jgi:hypothetical protein
VESPRWEDALFSVVFDRNVNGVPPLGLGQLQFSGSYFSPVSGRVDRKECRQGELSPLLTYEYVRLLFRPLSPGVPKRWPMTKSVTQPSPVSCLWLLIPLHSYIFHFASWPESKVAPMRKWLQAETRTSPRGRLTHLSPRSKASSCH